MASNIDIRATSFNSRLQPTQIGLGTSSTDSSILRLDYGYGSTTSNNDNVMSQRIVISGSSPMDVTQNYSYDSLNRLLTATEIKTSDSSQQWQQTYDIDRWGNRAVRVGSLMPNSALTPQSGSATDFSAFDQTKNRLKQATYPNVMYDDAGNLTKDQTARSFEYDAENRQIKFNSSTQNYFYDGDGHRVKKVFGSDTTVFVYNVAGQLIAEYTSGTSPSGGTSYLTSDHLGSTRVVTNQSGGVKARYDYLPFGEELGAGIGLRTATMGYSPSISQDSTKQKFTQKEGDSESGLDYFLARYYSSAQGRFTSIDPVRGDKGNPQSWNLFAYVTNNPLNYVDPFGLWKEIAPGIWEWQKDDTWKTLSLQSGIPKKLLRRAFNGAQLGSGLVVDVRGARVAAGENISAGLTDTKITPLFANVAQEMNRRESASMHAIEIFGALNLAPAAAASVGLSGGIATLGLSGTGLYLGNGTFAVIGGLDATSAWVGVEGAEVLNVAEGTYSITQNLGWIHSIIARRLPVLMVSGASQMWKDGELTKFGMEVRELLSAGYHWVGDKLLP